MHTCIQHMYSTLKQRGRSITFTQFFMNLSEVLHLCLLNFYKILLPKVKQRNITNVGIKCLLIQEPFRTFNDITVERRSVPIELLVQNIYILVLHMQSLLHVNLYKQVIKIIDGVYILCRIFVTAMRREFWMIIRKLYRKWDSTRRNTCQQLFSQR